MNYTDEITGIVDRFFFQSLDTGFSVFVIQMKNKKETIVRGYTPSIQPGEQVHLTGSWVMHPKFGKQFEAKTCTAELPTSILGLKKYLSSGLIRGIGPVYAQKMVDHFGSQVLEIIDKNPDALLRIEGIGKKRVDTIAAAWKDQKEIATIMVFLQDKGISTTYATKIYKRYRHEAIALVKENPYRLAEDIWGIGFKTADQIAQAMGFEVNSVKRARAGLLFAITNMVSSEGHLYCELEALKEKTIELLELKNEEHHETQKLLKNALTNLYDADKIKLITAETAGVTQHFITLSAYYHTERSVASRMKTIIETPAKRTFDLDALYKKLRVGLSEKIQLNEDQQQGILTCLQHKITVITGGPGTGKTTLIKQLLTLLEEEQCRYKLAAPTGRAAKRITEGTGRHATTIHRLLGFDVSTMGFVHNEQNALQLDFLIIDEASMIDIFLANAIIKALPYHAHLLLIGDIDQLPSVGAGNVLKDCIESKKIASVRLTQIFRQAQDSLIIVNAHRVNSGEFPRTSLPDTKRDFIYIKEMEPENVSGILRTLFTQRLKQHGITPSNTMVLTPMNRGGIGTHKLNYDLQQLLNPIKTEQQIAHGGSIFKLGDRVMQIRNNYDKHVFNGDIGTIDSINVVDKTIAVRYDTIIVTYEYNELDELVLAYAITIHKSQGSEYQAVIIPIFTQHFTLLQRNLLYTAITRAKKLCIVIGQPKALAIAIHNNKSIVRKTFLKEFLTTDLTCR